MFYLFYMYDCVYVCLFQPLAAKDQYNVLVKTCTYVRLTMEKVELIRHEHPPPYDNDSQTLSSSSSAAAAADGVQQGKVMVEMDYDDGSPQVPVFKSYMSYIVMAAFTLSCCCPFLGVIGLVYAGQSSYCYHIRAGMVLEKYIREGNDPQNAPPNLPPSQIEASSGERLRQGVGSI